MSKLELRSGFEALLPQDFESVKTFKQVPKRVGGPGFLILGVVTEDLDAAKKFADTLVPKLEELSTVRYVLYKKENQFLSDNRLLYVEEAELDEIQLKLDEEVDKKKLEANPFYFSLDFEEEEPENLDSYLSSFEEKIFGNDVYFVSKDKSASPQMLAILVKPRGFPSDISFTAELLAQVDRTIEQVKPESFHPSMYVFPLGGYKFNLLELEQIKRDVSGSFAIALLFICIMLLLYFRSWRMLVWIAVPPIVGLTWTFAATYLTIGYLTTQTAFMGAILLGLVVDTSIHLSNHYLIAKDEVGDDNAAAIKVAIETSLKPILAAVLTTAGAFFMLSFTDFLAFKHFGIIGSMGLILCTAATYIIIGLLAVLFPIKRVEFDRNLWVRFIKLLSRGSITKRVPLSFLTFAVLLAVVGALGIKHIAFEYDINNLNTTFPENERHLEIFRGVFAKGLTPTVLLPNNLEQTQEAYAVLEKKMKAGELSTVDRVETIYTILPQEQEKKLAKISQIKTTFDKYRGNLEKKYDKDKIAQWSRWLDVKAIALEDLPQNLTRLFEGVDGSLGLFINIYPSVDTNNGENLIAFAGQVASVETSQGTLYAGGEQNIFADILALMKQDGKLAVIYAFCFIVLILFLIYRRPRRVMTIMAPLVVSSLVLCGCMAYFDIKLNFFNFIVFPSILGIGVDNGIHIFNRFRDHPGERVRRTLATTGGAITMTSFTTMIGFATLLMAKNQALYSVGLLAVVGVGLSWICSVTVLPAILKLIREKQGYAIDASEEPAIGKAS